MIPTYPQELPQADQVAIALLLVGAPHLNYKGAEGREDGFISRMHKGAFIYRHLSIKSKLYASGREYFEVESLTKKQTEYHRVELDTQDGQHLCTCLDGAYHHICAHIFAALLKVANETVAAWNEVGVDAAREEAEAQEAAWEQQAEPSLDRWLQEAARYGQYANGTKSLLELEEELYGPQ